MYRQARSINRLQISCTEDRLKIFLWQDSCLHKNNDPARGAVVLTGGEDEADDVHDWGEERTKLLKVDLFQGLGVSVTKGYSNLDMGLQRTQVD